MATAAKLFENLADSLNRSRTSIEAYGLALTKFGWWSRNKRGRAASPRTVNDGSKLLLAILANGPSELAQGEGGVEGFFLDYANLRVAPNVSEQKWVRSVIDELGLPEDARFLDFIAAFVSLYIENAVERVVFHSPEPEGFYGEDVCDCPSIEFRIKGPNPTAGIRFMLSHSILDRLKKAGEDIEPLMGVKEITFAHYFFAQLAEAQRKGDRLSVEAFANAIQAVAKANSRGIGFERFICEMQFEAIASAFRDDGFGQSSGGNDEDAD